MEITFTDLQKKVRLNSPQILKITKAILRHENIDQATLSIVFVSHQRIRALNQRYLNRNHVTDVLAFDLGDGGVTKRKPKTISGDIIISTDAALKSVKTYETTLSQELTLYVIHGILHLLGYDDHKASDIKRMRKREEMVLLHLGKRIKDIAH